MVKDGWWTGFICFKVKNPVLFETYIRVETARKVLYTGHIGDGKIFVYNCLDVVKVRTGETGADALLDVE